MDKAHPKFLDKICTMRRADYQASVQQFIHDTSDTIIGSLATHASFAVDLEQCNAWLAIVLSLKSAVSALSDGHVFIEFTIPRMGRRADAVILTRGCLFVLEYKIGAQHFSPADIDQVVGYALDLKNFHESSHPLRIFPILIATEARPIAASFALSDDGIGEPVLTNGLDLDGLLSEVSGRFGSAPIDPVAWTEGRYKPTPTIVEAAQYLYRNHRVDDITRNEAGAENLARTAAYVSSIIDHSKAARVKSICFITGIPGSGKTLAGLNIASIRTQVAAEEYAVFLSGNGPLVKVLREALSRDQRKQLEGPRVARSRGSGLRSVEQFIQNIHHFRDENLKSDRPPIERVVLFDEAQRAWNREKTTQFMKQKRKHHDFDASEPEFLLSVMDRHVDWCTVVCLVGNGQEINTGEAGLSEWLNALVTRFPAWETHLSDRIVREPSLFGLRELPPDVRTDANLHLSTAIRSFRSEYVSSFASAVIDGKTNEAFELSSKLGGFEFKITRDLAKALNWLRRHRRGTERAGILAFSNAMRLKPKGVFVKARIDPVDWFLADRTDVRSSDYLEDVATEFDVQGLELDWACVCVDANLRVTQSATLNPVAFRGTRWQSVSAPDRRRYILNAHRVLLTRARQGVILFVPEGEVNDSTRNPDWYDALFSYFVRCGVKTLED